MFAVSTVRVVHPGVPDGYVIINETDLTDDHELWTDAPVLAGLRVGKGPRGKWYVCLERERVEGPFESEADASAALSAKNGG